LKQKKGYNFFVEPCVEFSSQKIIISDSIEHILIIKYVNNNSDSTSGEEMLQQDEFSGMGHYIFIMLSKNTNKATIIEQTGGEKVDEKKAL
jgi:hypothetical protein